MKRFLNLVVYILTIRHVSGFTDRRTVSPGTFISSYHQLTSKPCRIRHFRCLLFVHGVWF